MTRTKYRFLPFMLVIILLVSALAPPNAYSVPAREPVMPDSEEARKILEDSLSIVEIDYEIERITVRQKELEMTQRQLKDQIVDIESRIDERRERAGAVLRSYYMGERDHLLIMLLSAQSLSGFFRILDFYDIIIQNDRKVLQAYDQQYRELRSARARADRNASELAQVKANLVQQRQRVVALQQQVDGALSSSGNPEAMRTLIEEFTLYWENVGLYEVRRHFQALASAMDNLPGFIQGSKNMLSTNGKIYTINIHEDDLNEFLRSEDKLFETFAFQFDDGKVTASGESGNLSLLIEGRYSIVNEPQNAILFEVDRLVFNRLELPDTTRKALQNEFDMNFYPKQLISFLKATEVTSSDQRLIVRLELDM